MDHPTHITINPDGVVDPLKKAVAHSTHAVGICIKLLEGADLTSPEFNVGSIVYQFDASGWPEHERGPDIRNWLFAAGFHSLVRGIREMLEEAHLYICLMQLGRETTFADYDQTSATSRQSAQRAPFPELLRFVEDAVGEPLLFGDVYRSLQSVRNCLEHRAGIVGRKDVNDQTARLDLLIPRLKMYYMRGEEEVEIVKGERVDAGLPLDENGQAPNVQLLMKTEIRTTSYNIGEQIRITVSEFAELAMACRLFGDAVMSKLEPRMREVFDAA